MKKRSVRLIRFMLRLATAVYCCLMFAGMSEAMSINAYAYIDPSVMTYAIQVVAGVVVAIGAVVGFRLRRIKKKMQEKLGIDENAKKEVEDDVIEISGDEQK